MPAGLPPADWADRRDYQPSLTKKKSSSLAVDIREAMAEPRQEELLPSPLHHTLDTPERPNAATGIAGGAWRAASPEKLGWPECSRGVRLSQWL
jgi:hypothetical protein